MRVDAQVLYISVKLPSLYEFLISEAVYSDFSSTSVIFRDIPVRRSVSTREKGLSGSYSERTILDLESCVKSSSISPYIYILHVYPVY